MYLLKELILISLGNRNSFEKTLSYDDWKMLFNEARKQSLIGICYQGIERLVDGQRPSNALLMQWFGLTSIIEKQNRLFDKRAKDIARLFAEAGFRTCVLKGQGIATLYPNPFRRTCGDIDIWVDGSRKRVLEYLEGHYKVGSVVVHHADVEIFNDVATEIHFHPSYTYNPFRYIKYKRWFSKQEDTLFNNIDKKLGFAYPTLAFNATYSLLHIFRHVFHEGIGLRQLLDYYYILNKLSESERKEALITLRGFGLGKFAAAVMYVEKQIFELDDIYLLCNPDTKAGEFLLAEILKAGNFGQYDERIKAAHSGGRLKLYVYSVWRNIKMIKYFSSEALWSPLWKIGHWVWRKWNHYE